MFGSCFRTLAVILVSDVLQFARSDVLFGPALDGQRWNERLGMETWERRFEHAALAWLGEVATEIIFVCVTCPKPSHWSCDDLCLSCDDLHQ